MYYDRILSSDEALYISRAQQRILKLSRELSQGFVDNDIPFEAGELIIELEYSIKAIKSSFLLWTPDETRMVIDYYTVRANLVVFGFREITFLPTAGVEGQVWATVESVVDLTEESREADAALVADIYNLTTITTYLQFQLDNLENSYGGYLTRELTSDIDVGGIHDADVFPINTPLTDVIEILITSPPIIDTLSFDTYVPAVEVGDTLTVSDFSWVVQKGTPSNLKLSDSEGILVNEPVTGSSYVPGAPIDYPFSSHKKITWTLSGDFIDDVIIDTEAFYMSFYGKKAVANDTPVAVTEADILAGSKTFLGETEVEVTFLGDVANTEQAFIAVEQSQMGSEYNRWLVEHPNVGNIASGEFILNPTVVLVNGRNYSVFRWGYRSPLVKNITLTK